MSGRAGAGADSDGAGTDQPRERKRVRFEEFDDDGFEDLLRRQEVSLLQHTLHGCQGICQHTASVHNLHELQLLLCRCRQHSFLAEWAVPGWDARWKLAGALLQACMAVGCQHGPCLRIQPSSLCFGNSAQRSAG